MKKNIKWFVISPILLTIFAIIGANMVNAWVVQNPIWNISSSTVVNYRANELPTGNFQNRLSDARTSWNNVSPARIQLVRNDVSYGIRVYDGYIDGAGGTLGNTIRYYPWDTYISSATIQVDENENWYTGTGTPGGTQFDLQSLLAHELGHSMAIQHSNATCTGDSRPTMCSGLVAGTIYKRTLQADDQGALNYLYP